MRWPLYLGICCLQVSLTGCHTLDVSGPSAKGATQAPPAKEWSGWQAQPLPGKALTRYTPVRQGDGWFLEARAERSASIWRRKLPQPLAEVDQVRFSWRVDALPVGADIAEDGKTDAPARVMLAFAGDTARLTPRHRAMFELAELVTGEAPPYATLVYVWDSTRPPGTVLRHPKTDRVRKIVVDGGPDAMGQWRHHQRDVRRDFETAFGEAPGALVALMVMTDSDNTQSSARAIYGPVTVRQ